MKKVIPNNKIRVELWLLKSESNFIKRNICKEGEQRKTAIERIVRTEIDKTKRRQLQLQ